jgi:hypothetical protein
MNSGSGLGLFMMTPAAATDAAAPGHKYMLGHTFYVITQRGQRVFEVFSISYTHHDGLTHKHQEKDVWYGLGMSDEMRTVGKEHPPCVETDCVRPILVQHYCFILELYLRLCPSQRHPCPYNLPRLLLHESRRGGGFSKLALNPLCMIVGV